MPEKTETLVGLVETPSQDLPSVKNFSFGMLPSQLEIVEACKRVIQSESCGLGVSKTIADMQLIIAKLEAQIPVWVKAVALKGKLFTAEDIEANMVKINPFVLVSVSEKIGNVKFFLDDTDNARGLKTLLKWYVTASEAQLYFTCLRKNPSWREELSSPQAIEKGVEIPASEYLS